MVSSGLRLSYTKMLQNSWNGGVRLLCY